MNWNKLSDIGGTMNKKKRIEEIRLARLRELQRFENVQGKWLRFLALQ